MDDEQVEQHVASYARLYPSLISFDQAAAIAQVTLKSIYHWSSTKLFDGFKVRRGRHARLTRDRFVRFLVTQQK